MTSTPVILPEQALAEATGKPVMIQDGEGYTGGFDTGENVQQCGDYSLAAEPQSWRTWALGREAEPFLRITTTFYVQAQIREADGSFSNYLDVSDLDDARRDGKDLVFTVECQVEYLHFSDLEDPGGSEVRSDYEYESGSPLFYSSLEEAQNVAERNARNMDWSESSWSPENA